MKEDTDQEITLELLKQRLDKLIAKDQELTIESLEKKVTALERKVTALLLRDIYDSQMLFISFIVGVTLTAIFVHYIVDARNYFCGIASFCSFTLLVFLRLFPISSKRLYPQESEKKITETEPINKLSQ